MKPPICAFCKRDFRSSAEEGGLVKFSNYESLPDGMTGHPKGMEWFCGKHLEAARSLSELSLKGAIGAMRKKYWWRPWRW